MNWKRWLLIGIVVVAALAVGGPFVYSEFISGDAPKRLTIGTSSPGTDIDTGASGDPEGNWTLASGSQVGYRVNEVLFGRNNEAVGRTTSVEGALQIDATTVESGSFTVDMTTIASDQERRDRQFHGRIMDTSSFPTSTFTFSDPIRLGSVPADGATVKKTVSGKLTLRGTTKTVSVTVEGRKSGDTLEVAGTIPIVFAEWDIPSPSFGPVTTEDNGLLEFALKFSKG